MPRYKYLIIGGGMTAAAAIRGIREIDPRGGIGVIGAEPHPPYDRPPLSKGLWKGGDPATIFCDIADSGADLLLGRGATRLDRRARRVRDDRGEDHTYEKLLLATGGTPRRLDPDADGIIYYRTLDDYERLRALADRLLRFVVVGGGFIGSEIAAALAMNGREVTMVFPGEGIGSRMFPPEHAAFLTRSYCEKGVTVMPRSSVVRIERRGGACSAVVRDLGTSEEREIPADCVVAGIGIAPNAALAESAGLEVEDGIVVDRNLRTSDPDVYAAGDVASFYNPALQARIRVEHEDNANRMGQAAGRSMAGAGVSYDHLPFFYSDLFEHGYEAVGLTDSGLETFADWKDPHREGVIYYLKEGRVRGVVLWNVWGEVASARRLIEAAGPLRAEDLKGRLPAAV